MGPEGVAMPLRARRHEARLESAGGGRPTAADSGRRSLDTLVVRTVSGVTERRLVLPDNPDTVYRGIKKMHDHLGGFGSLLIGQAGFLDDEETMKGKTFFVRKVYPRLKDLPESG
jgi:hypothetical protein